MNEPTDKDLQYDRIMKINLYLLERYGKDLLSDFKIEPTGDVTLDFATINKLLDYIYEQENEKYPDMWYNYLCSFN